MTPALGLARKSVLRFALEWAARWLPTFTLWPRRKMSAVMGHKQSREVRLTSALRPIADICRGSGPKRGAYFCLGDPELTKYAHAHKDIIDRFGRFPHRNAILGPHRPWRKWNSSKGQGNSF